MIGASKRIVRVRSMLRRTCRRLASFSGLVGSLLIASSISFGAWMPEEIPGIIYPRVARLARVTGEVTVEFEIGADGRVIDAKALSGPSLLRAASVKTAKQWHFKASDNEESTFRATFEFRLEGLCRTTQSCNERFVIHYPDRIVITSEIPVIQPAAAGANKKLR
jgi:TonB family protein